MSNILTRQSNPIDGPTEGSLQHTSSISDHDKKQKANVEVQELPSESSRLDTTVWNPGWFSQFPWLGLGSLFGVLLCSTAAIIVLALSDTMAEERWPKGFKPSVILAGLNSVSNLFFGLAIAHGVTIAWWRKALQGTTIEKLHKNWLFGSSFISATFAGRAFNIIALAALAAKLSIIDGMLMQSAESAYIGAGLPKVTHAIEGFANENFGMTGLTETGSANPEYINSDVFENLVVWDQNKHQLPLTAFKNCDGRCFAKIPAAGFHFECSTASNAINFTVDQENDARIVLQNGTSLYFNGSQSNNGQTIFSVDFSHHYPNTTTGALRSAEYLTMSVTYVESARSPTNNSRDCTGSLYDQTCILRPAIIDYPIMIENYTAGSTHLQGLTVGVTEESYPHVLITTDFNETFQQQQGFDFIQEILLNDTLLDNASTETSLAGIEKAFAMYFGGRSTIQWSEQGGWSVDQDGNARQFLADATALSCATSYNSPTNPPRDETHPSAQSVVASINQIMFAIATNVSHGYVLNPASEARNYTGVMYTDTLHYQTRWSYAAGAVVSTLFCILCVLPVYWGYWQLGRKVTLDPFEIAHAFQSPITARATHGDIEKMMSEVGKEKIRYGHIVAGDAHGVLGLAEPKMVISPS